MRVQSTKKLLLDASLIHWFEKYVNLVKLSLIIMEVSPLIPIGAKIKVDKSKIENLLPNKLLDELPQIINGVIVDYKWQMVWVLDMY